MVVIGYVLLAYMCGVLSVVGIKTLGSLVSKLVQTRRKENRRVERRKFNIASYVEMSKHNDQAAVDRLFGLKKGRI